MLWVGSGVGWGCAIRIVLVGCAIALAGVLTACDSSTPSAEDYVATQFAATQIASTYDAAFRQAQQATQQAVQGQSQPTSGLAPDFEFTTFDGQTMKLSDLRGKVVVLNFCASWAGPCRDEAPELQAAWEHYQDSGDVVFLGIAYADNDPRAVEFLNEFGITYLNAPDLGTRISEQYHIQGVPETFIINQDGNVERFIFAGVTREALKRYIDPLLQET